MAIANDVPRSHFHAAPEAGYTTALQALVRLRQVVKEAQHDDLHVAENGADGHSARIVSMQRFRGKLRPVESEPDSRFNIAGKCFIQTKLSQPWTCLVV